MTLSHDDANARLLELVYGEAAPVERAALEAHVATCERCAADLAALGETRARARVALDDGDRDVPVPARVHARLLAAATQAVAPVAALARPPVAVASPPMPAAPVPPSAPSFWERLRGKWTLPTFATLGAVAVVVIASKIFLEPRRTMERGREVAGGSAPPPPPAVTTARSLEKGGPEPGATQGAGPAEAQPRHFGTGSLGGLMDAAKQAHGTGAHSGLFDAASPIRPARLRGVGGSAAGLGAGSPAKPSLEPSPERYAAPPSGWKGSAEGKADKAMNAPAAAPAAPPAPAPTSRNATASRNDALARDRRGGAPTAELDEEAASSAAAADSRAATSSEELAKKKSAPSDEPRRSPAPAPAPAAATRAPAAKEEERRLEEKDVAAGKQDDGASN
jgi:hypothetical protein